MNEPSQPEASTDAAATSHGLDVRFSWPEVPAHIAPTVELRCECCGYKMKWSAKKKPTDFDATWADFVRRHTNCKPH
jgi:hypothetical protein